MLVKRCNLCKHIDDVYIGDDDDVDYCYECASLINTMRMDAERKIGAILKDQYDEVVTNSAGIMRLLKHLYTESPEEYTKQFGTQGLNMLKQALKL
jgi:hypothetical protein